MSDGNLHVSRRLLAPPRVLDPTTMTARACSSGPAPSSARWRPPDPAQRRWRWRISRMAVVGSTRMVPAGFSTVARLPHTCAATFSSICGGVAAFYSRLGSLLTRWWCAASLETRRPPPPASLLAWRVMVVVTWLVLLVRKGRQRRTTAASRGRWGLRCQAVIIIFL